MRTLTIRIEHPRYLALARRWLICVFIIFQVWGCGGGGGGMSGSESSHMPEAPPPVPPSMPPPLAPSSSSAHFAARAATTQQRLDTGFFPPTDDRSALRRLGADWLASSCGGDNSYVAGGYHLAVDIPSPEGHPVFAIADGTITYRNDGDAAWGPGNSAVFVRHTVFGGGTFLAVYAHIQLDPNFATGSPVVGGHEFAKIGPYPASRPHLHLGILPRAQVPGTTATIGFGAARCSPHWPDAMKFNRSYSINANWAADWELRGADFNTSQGSTVTVWHATYKPDPNFRFVTFFDPERNAYDGWSIAPGQSAPSKEVQAKKDILNRTLVGDFPFAGGPDSNDFVDPIAWVTTQVPKHPWNTQAADDITRRALRDSRFYALVGSNVLGANVNWSPGAYELRWIDIPFAGSRPVRLYHATATSNPSYRLTIFFDPDRQAWTGWETVS